MLRKCCGPLPGSGGTEWGWGVRVITESRSPSKARPFSWQWWPPLPQLALPAQVPSLPPGAASTHGTWASEEQEAMWPARLTLALTRPPGLWPGSLLSQGLAHPQAAPTPPVPLEF